MPVTESIRYSPDFPPESRARVAAERLRAGQDFDHAREKPLPSEYGAKRDLEAELRKYILRPFAVFVSEACQLGCRGIWSVDRVEEEAREFLRLETIEARFNKGFDKSGRAFGQDWIDSWGNIEPKVMREFERSDEWRQFQAGLLHVAECQAKPTSAAAATSDRRAAVEAFLVECNRCTELPPGSTILKKHIWLAAGHTHRRQFHYWQSESDKATEEDDRNFRRILSMPPGEFLDLLKKKDIL